MSRKILGLDIRHDAVSAVLVATGIKGTAIEAHEYIPVSNQRDREDGFAGSLKTIAEKMDILGSICVAAFPADRISYRNLKVPFKGKKKISKILPYEIEPTLPLPVDDLIIDFHVVERSDITGHTNLIAAAVEKSELQSYLDTLSMFDIEPEILTVGGYSAALCINSMIDGDRNWLFFDIDANNATAVAGVPGGIRLIRSFPIYAKDAQSKAEQFCTHLNRTLSAFEDALGSDFQPDEIFVTGCGLDDSVLESRISKIQL